MSQPSLFWFENVEHRAHPWPGLNWVTTLIAVPDVKKARDLYVAAFNFVSIFDNPNPTDPDDFITTRMRYRGANFVLNKEGTDSDAQAPATSGSVSPFVFYIYIDNTEVAYDQALKCGMTSMLEPHDTPWGDRRARVRCPFGYVWDLAHRL